ncbi:MAG: DUF362 domain-containing protein [Chloroflexota bacterium]
MNDKSKNTISRRTFLIGGATLIGGAALAQVYRLLAKAGALANESYLPMVSRSGSKATATNTRPANATATRTPTRTNTPNHTPTRTGTPTRTATKPAITPMPGAGRVVHVRHASATSWKGEASPCFYDSTRVSQTAINAMVLDGLTTLTGQSGWAAIWHSLFSRIRAGGYSQGQTIAIKVNFNNSINNGNTCTTHNNIIDALPQPICALIAGMKAANVRESDIVIYDASGRPGAAGWTGKTIPGYFRNTISANYPGVRYIGKSDCSGVTEASWGKHSSLAVNFPGIQMQTRLLADVLYDATYLINVPILKVHGGTAAIPVSLGFKNHLGSINYVFETSEGDPNCFHAYINPTQGLYSQNANPLATLYSHACIAGKTILTLGDGLYGAFGAASTAWPIWSSFGGGAPNSLFFATDPVAIDCVMADILRAEGKVARQYTYDYLFCAQEAGLGICEGTRATPGGNPFQTPYGSGYGDLTYIRHDLS